MPLTFFGEDTLERRKDMLDILPIIRHIHSTATKIINFYSIFPETRFLPQITQIDTDLYCHEKAQKDLDADFADYPVFFTTPGRDVLRQNNKL